MVYDGEDGIVSVAVGELGDQIHGYYLKRLSEGWNIDLIWWGSSSMCECFVLLALGTPFDVVFHPFGHGGPPGNSLGSVDGPVSSYVCRRWFVMYQMEEAHLSSSFGGSTILPSCFQRRIVGSMADLTNLSW